MKAKQCPCGAPYSMPAMWHDATNNHSCRHHLTLVPLCPTCVTVGQIYVYLNHSRKGRTQ